METKFERLNLDGAIISELRVVPALKVVMTLLRGPEKQKQRLVQTQHDLQFNGVKDFKIELESEPWLQIQSHAAFSSSEYLSNSLANTGSDPQRANLQHFEIVCSKGRIDIIAQSLTFSKFNEIAYKEPATSNE